MDLGPLCRPPAGICHAGGQSYEERKTVNMRACERLIQYAKIWTTSDEHSGKTPSTMRQFDLARLLVSEMKALGIEDARVDEHCYVYGSIPATEGYEDRTSIGLIAHLDTALDCSGENVSPRIHKDYDGGKLEIGNGRVLDPDLFPHLKTLAGHTLITTDGTTLLGADDKAGIAAILTLAQLLIEGSGEETLPGGCDVSGIPAGSTGVKIPHGPVRIAFTPDEEIGGGAYLLDLDAFGADYAYTVDGGAPQMINYETFNAATARFEIKGLSVHPGSAKGIMKNAALIACEIIAMLPSAETPQNTEGYEGFYHLFDLKGSVESASVRCLIRDHSAQQFEVRQKMLRFIEKTVNEKYGAGTCTLTIDQQYRNMEENIEPCMHLVDNVKKVMEELGLRADTAPIRGGTDGSQLSYRGLPCPNLGTGGYCFHGPLEHITAENMDTVVRILLGIVRCYAQK